MGFTTSWPETCAARKGLIMENLYGGIYKIYEEYGSMREVNREGRNYAKERRNNHISLM